MSEYQSALVAFANSVAPSQLVWALTTAEGDEWVVCDSAQFEDSSVLLLWSSEAAAKAQCQDEWSIYQPQAIALEEYLDFWVEDLNEDGTLVGLDWTDNGENPEVEPVELAKTLLETGAFTEQA